MGEWVNGRCKNFFARRSLAHVIIISHLLRAPMTPTTNVQNYCRLLAWCQITASSAIQSVFRQHFLLGKKSKEFVRVSNDAFPYSSFLQVLMVPTLKIGRTIQPLSRRMKHCRPPTGLPSRLLSDLSINLTTVKGIIVWNSRHHLPPPHVPSLPRAPSRVLLVNARIWNVCSPQFLLLMSWATQRVYAGLLLRPTLVNALDMEMRMMVRI